MFTKKTIHDIEVGGKKVLLRADYNVPVKNGQVTSDYRIKQSLPTIKALLDKGVRSLVIISHLGRPDPQNKKDFSLKPVADKLAELLGRDVVFIPDCHGDKTRSAVSELPEGGIALLENLRFYKEEETNNEEHARKILADSGAEVFVQDGFGVVHRAHASTDAIARQGLPAVAGLLLEKEVETINKAMEDPEKPLIAVVGGAKISDKIEILKRLIETADCVAVAGAMANNFLLAEGYEVGKSLIEDDALDSAREIMERARQVEKERRFNFLVPVDVVVSADKDGHSPTRIVDLASNTVADIQAYPKIPEKNSHEVGEKEIILDIGPLSASTIAGAVSMSRTVLWNGTCGVTEAKGINGAHAPFTHGTKTIVQAMIGSSQSHANRPYCVVGGGDTVAYVESEGLTDEFSHVSTGGGASLELMAGKKLPGVEVLWNKE